MSLREAVPPAARAVRPALLLVGGGVVALQAILFLVGWRVTASFHPLVGNVLAPVATAVAVAVGVPLSVALYVPVDRGCEDLRPTLRAARAGLRQHYWAAVRAQATAVLAVALVALAAGAAWVVVGTGIRYGMYARGSPRPPVPMRTISEVQLVAFATAALGFFATRFADVFVVFGDASPRTGWRASLRFVRRRPVSVLSYALVTALLLGVPTLVVELGTSSRGPSVALFPIAFVGSVVGLVAAAALHVTYFRNTVAPTVDSPSLPVLRWGRVAAVAIVLLAAVSGAVAVRTADLETGQDGLHDLPDDPDAALAVAVENTERANHRYVRLRRNESDPDATFERYNWGGVDYDDRQRYSYFAGPEGTVSGYFDEGVLATRNGSEFGRERFGPLARSAGDWDVVAGPGYGLTYSDSLPYAPETDANWTVASRNESTLVYRVDSGRAVRRVLRDLHRGAEPPLAPNSFVSVTVDRERGVVDRVRVRLHSRSTGEDWSYVTRFESVGTADLERPREVGPWRPLERFWDVAYY